MAQASEEEEGEEEMRNNEGGSAEAFINVAASTPDRHGSPYSEKTR